MKIIDLCVLGEGSVPCEVRRIQHDGTESKEEKVVPEETLMDVYVDEVLTLKMVCTGSDLSALIIGHLYSERMIASAEEIESVYVCEFGNRAKVYTKNGIRAPAKPIEIRACDCGGNGVLGRNDILAGGLKPLPPFAWEPAWIFTLAEALDAGAPLHSRTRAAHCCLLALEGKLLYRCEDIGRHNAMDKAIGRALIDGVDLTRCILYVSGRVPVDMIQKAVCARVPVLASHSAPTNHAVDIAKACNATLICSARRDYMNVFSDGNSCRKDGADFWYCHLTDLKESVLIAANM